VLRQRLQINQTGKVAHFIYVKSTNSPQSELAALHRMEFDAYKLAGSSKTGFSPPAFPIHGVPLLNPGRWALSVTPRQCEREVYHE